MTLLNTLMHSSQRSCRYMTDTTSFMTSNQVISQSELMMFALLHFNPLLTPYQPLINPLLSLIAYRLILAYVLPFTVASYHYGILLTSFLHTPFLCLHQLFLPFAFMSTLHYVLPDHSMVPCLLFICGTFCGLLRCSTAFLTVLCVHLT
jgi:hypothetical protein